MMNDVADDVVASRGEAAWVRKLRTKLTRAFAYDDSLHVDVAQRIIYRYEILSYQDNSYDPEATMRAGYQTDLLLWENKGKTWVPRIVIECKLGSLTTHDALTYSAKAATHKQVHPYLRYGILVGALPAVPPRLLHHGAHFDFMASWRTANPSLAEFGLLVRVLKEETGASRLLSRMTIPGAKGEKHSFIHRPFVIPKGK